MEGRDILEPASRGPSIEQVVQAMGHDDPRRRIQAIKAAASLKDPRLADAALETLRGEGVPQLRLGFVQLVGLVGEARHAKALRPYARDPVDAIRYRCLEALLRIGDETHYDLLVHGVEDEEKKIRSFCVEKLLALEGKAFPDLLGRMIASSDGADRRAAVACAGKFRGKEMIRLLIAVAEDVTGEDELREAARKGLEKLAEKGSKKAAKWLRTRTDAGGKAPASPGGTSSGGGGERGGSSGGAERPVKTGEGAARRRVAVDLEPVRLGPIRTEERSVGSEGEGAAPVALTPSRARPVPPDPFRPSSKALRVRRPSSQALIPICPSGVRGVAHWDFFVGGMNMLAAALFMASGEGLFMFLALVFGAIGAFHIAMGRALKEGRSWARTANIVFAVLQLPSVPVGTLIGILVLHTLYSDEGKAYFGKGS